MSVPPEVETLKTKLERSYVCRCRVRSGGQRMEVVVSSKLFKSTADYKRVLEMFEDVKDELDRQGIPYREEWPSKPTSPGVHHASGYFVLNLRDWQIRRKMRQR